MKPWHQFQIDHPNRFFEDTYRDYKYLVYQHDYGHLNGYVLLKEDDDREKASDLQCHGGITFDDDLSFVILTESGHYIGFDCNHWNDIAPFLEERLREVDRLRLFEPFMPYTDEPRFWRTEGYVIDNCKSIIDQLIELKNKV